MAGKRELSFRIAARLGLDDEAAWRLHTFPKRVKRALRRPLEWLGIFLAELVFSNVPHGALLRLCDAAGALFYVFDGRGRRLSLANLRVIEGKGPPVVAGLMQHAFNPKRLAYDPTRREKLIVRRSYRNMARTIGHVFWTSKRAAERAASVAEFSQECRDFLAANATAITVSAHLGCWEVLSQLVHLTGHPMVSVAKDIGSKAMTRLLMKSRRSIGQEILPAQGAFRPLMQALKDGKDIGLLVDQFVNKKDGGAWTWFLGRPMCVSVAPAFLSAKSHAPIVVAWSRPLKDGRYRCEKLAEFRWEKGMDIRGRTSEVLSAIERAIRRHPSCWVLNYRYFNEGPTEAELAELRGREYGIIRKSSSDTKRERSKKQMKPTLVVLAAGMGSRYGGLKQVDPVGPSGEAILDYSVFDAVRGGFGKVVFIIRKDFEQEFKDKVGRKYEGLVPVEYCFQDMNDLPAPYKVPEGRTKPWGTAHATRASRGVVKEPFAVINADDFYGRDAFAKLGAFLSAAKPMEFAMVGYKLDLTLSDNGSVARGVCSVGDDGALKGVTEMTKLVRAGDVAENRENPDAPVKVPLDARVSMNLWGFTPELYGELEARFPAWLAENGAKEKSEWFIPFVVDELIREGKATCRVLPTESSWFGVTYREDKPFVMAEIKKLVDAGEYPAKLF